jgi:hypothetical protein
MTEPAPRDNRPSRAGRGAVLGSPRVLRVLAVVFTLTAAGALALVGLDLFIARPAAGDVFITALNALAACVLWRRVSAQTRT